MQRYHIRAAAAQDHAFSFILKIDFSYAFGLVSIQREDFSTLSDPAAKNDDSESEAEDADEPAAAPAAGDAPAGAAAGVGGDGAGAANPQPQGNDNAPGGAVPGGLDLTGAAGTKTKTVVRDGIHKKVQEVKFVNELFLAVNDPDVEMGALCYARISRPVTFQHGCLVGLTNANIEARNAMIRLPVICMHEIGVNVMHSPYSRALQLFADTNATKIARHIGSMATEVFAALVKLHMANNAQYQRILQYGSSSVFELGIKDVLLQQDTLPPPVKWLVENVHKFSLTPQLWGWNDGKEVPAVYSVDFWDENKADMGTASRQRMVPAPTTMGKRIPRISVRDWETLVFDECKAAYEEGDGAFEPARKFVKYLLSSPNYYILKEFRKRAQMDSDPDDLLNFLNEILDVRILSTRDIEVTGKKINNASKAANYEGVLQGVSLFEICTDAVEVCTFRSSKRVS